MTLFTNSTLSIFLSTPSGWRATTGIITGACDLIISIHALRVEGDLHELEDLFFGLWISIHALRVEGDRLRYYRRFPPANFYPRPPGGGRRLGLLQGMTAHRFLSTPSGWRATYGDSIPIDGLAISIHALRVEGDRLSQTAICIRTRISIHALRVEGDKNGSADRGN